LNEESSIYSWRDMYYGPGAMVEDTGEPQWRKPETIWQKL
jgi:hypothetical protein